MKPSEPVPADTAPSERSQRRVIRAEKVFAILALLTSACASVAALWQSREAVVQTRATIAQTQTVADQLRASVWPYLTIEYVMTNTHVELDFVNQGLGPALIRTFTYSIDRRPHSRIREIANFFDPNTHARSVGENDFGGGSVVRPSQSFMIFAISDAKLNHARPNADAAYADRRLLLFSPKRLLEAELGRNRTRYGLRLRTRDQAGDLIE